MFHSNVGHVFASSLLVAACTGSTAANDVGSQTTQAQVATPDGGDGHSQGKHHGPPPEAFDACAAKAESAACTVTFGDKTISGTCVTPPSDAPDQRLVCRPDNGPDGHPHGRGLHGAPPEEVFGACTGKASGDACSVKFGDHTLDGTCREPPPGVQDSRLGCAPSGPPPHGSANGGEKVK